MREMRRCWVTDAIA